jgi:RsiW-degrading membrane proteinase PrsW (M82 family)
MVGGAKLMGDPILRFFFYTLFPLLFIPVIAGFLWLLFVYRKDRYEPEPLGKMLRGVVWGVFMLIPALFIEVFIEARFAVSALWALVLVAPIVEEACKGSYLLYMRRDPELEGPMDGLVYGACVGAGFDVIENIWYNVGYIHEMFTGQLPAWAFIELSIFRAVSPGHILFTGFFGLMIGMSKIRGWKYMILFSFPGAILLHAIWNYLGGIFVAIFFYLGGIVLVWISLVSLYAFILWKILEKAKEHETYVYGPVDEVMTRKVINTISTHGGATTEELATELRLPPHRSAVFAERMGAKFDGKLKRWIHPRASWPRYCTGCGGGLSPEDAYCPSCGRRIKK